MKRSRRQFLQWASSAGLLATAGCSAGDGAGFPVGGDTARPTETVSPIPRPSTTPTPVEISENDFASNVRSWTWFPSDDTLWSRSETPYDFRTDDRRWLAWPTEAGSIRCRVEGDAAPGNAGFYLDVGPIGSLEELTIRTETVHSDRNGPQQLLAAIYLDASEDDDYFQWEKGDGRETFAGFGTDVEAIGTVSAGGQATINLQTDLNLTPPTDDNFITLEDAVAGGIDGVSAATSAALQISVVGSGAHNVEEVLVHDVRIGTAQAFTELDWPMFCHDRLNTGSTTATAGPRSAVEPLWTFETGGTVRSSPAVVDGTVYIGSDDGSLYAIDAATGELRWTFETGGPIESSPAVFGYMVLVGSHDHRIYGIDVSGEQQWALETGDRVRSSPSVQASVPVIEGDVVVTGSDDANIYLQDPWTGELKFSYDTGAPVVVAPLLLTTAGGIWEASAGNTAGNEFGYFPRWEKYDDDVGATNYRWAPIHAATSAPFKPNETIWYLANDDGRLDRWEHPEPFPKPVWTFHAEDKIRSTPVLSAGHVLVGSWDGHLYGIDDGTGVERWSIETDGKVDASAGATSESVYFGSTDGTVYGVDISSGEVLWTYETGGEIHSSPAVADGTVYVGSDDGSVYALEEE